MSVCAICGGIPEFAVNWLLSTRRMRPRVQKCSVSVLLCDSCLQSSRLNLDSELPMCLLDSLHEAYTAINMRSSRTREGAE